jgi:hypothetical protein
LESSNKNYIFASEPKTQETIKDEIYHIPTENNKLNETSKENNMIIETSTPSNLTTEKKIIEHFNKENAVKVSTSEHYNIILPSEQKRIFNELIERMKTSTSIEELTDKHYKMQRYMNNHTFMIFYIEEEKKIFKELKDKLNTSTETAFSSPTSPSNALDGIVISPTDLKSLEAKKTASEEKEKEIEEAETPNDSFKCSISPSNNVSGTITPKNDERPSEALEIPLNQKSNDLWERIQRINQERIEKLKEIIDNAETVAELKAAATEVQKEKNNISTNQMAVLAELMEIKKNEL